MANTYTQLHFQVVFAVQNRYSLISNSWKDRLYQYMQSVIINHGHKPLAINGMADHVHMVFGMRPSQSVSDLVKQVKMGSSIWINDSKFISSKFRWQDGFGAFSYSKSQLPALIHYVINQEIHHQKKTFLEEYREILDRSETGYDPRFLFHEPA